MADSRIGIIMAALIAVAFPLGAHAQSDTTSDTAQEQAAPDAGNQEPADSMEEGGMDEPMDPASPEGDSQMSDESMTGEQDMESAEPADQAAPEDTGPADVISDSSERALSEADLEGLDCDNLWIARNEIFDRNGYCFRSDRGKDYFDNSDCTSDSQDILSSLEWENVRLIQSVEQERQCN